MSRPRRRGKRTDPEVAARRQQIAEVIAQVHAPVRPVAPTTPPPVDVAEQVRREVARQRRAEALAAEQAVIDRLAHPGGAGCVCCGVGWSGVRDLDGTVAAAWHHSPVVPGAHCEECDRELFSRVDELDAARIRVKAALLLLGIIHPDGSTTARSVGEGIPVLAVGNPSVLAPAMHWYCETPSAGPSERRWDYVDVDQLRQRWDALLHRPPPEPDALLCEHADPCPVCGVGDRWVRVPHHLGEGHTYLRCTGCKLDLDGADVDVIVSAMLSGFTGRSFVRGIASALGLRFFALAPRSHAAARPFGMWGDVAKTARKLWPTRVDFDAWYAREHSAYTGSQS